MEYLKVNQFLHLIKQIEFQNDFSFGEFPENFEHFEPYLEAAMKRVPILEKVGIRKFFAGPESIHSRYKYTFR